MGYRTKANGQTNYSAELPQRKFQKSRKFKYRYFRNFRPKDQRLAPTAIEDRDGGGQRRRVSVSVAACQSARAMQQGISASQSKLGSDKCRQSADRRRLAVTRDTPPASTIVQTENNPLCLKQSEKLEKRLGRKPQTNRRPSSAC